MNVYGSDLGNYFLLWSGHFLPHPFSQSAVVGNYHPGIRHYGEEESVDDSVAPYSDLSLHWLFECDWHDHRNGRLRIRPRTDESLNQNIHRFVNSRSSHVVVHVVCLLPIRNGHCNTFGQVELQRFIAKVSVGSPLVSMWVVLRIPGPKEESRFQFKRTVWLVIKSSLAGNHEQEVEYNQVAIVR